MRKIIVNHKNKTNHYLEWHNNLYWSHKREQ